MQFSAQEVKTLRLKTGAGVMDCKEALVAADGDMEEATKWLRKKGLAKSAKKADRAVADGLGSVVVDGLKAAIVELNSETDFVARNTRFQELARGITSLAISSEGSVSSLLDASYPETGRSVSDQISEVVAVVGENIQLRRIACLSVENGAIGSYIHNAVSDGMGRVGVLVTLDAPEGNEEKLASFARQIAMHVSAHDPTPVCVKVEDIDQKVLQREREVFTEQAALSGKPQEVVEKMVEGRLRKYCEEVTLLSQKFVFSPDITVGEFVKGVAEEIGAPISIRAFVRYAVGESLS